MSFDNNYNKVEMEMTLVRIKGSINNNPKIKFYG